MHHTLAGQAITLQVSIQAAMTRFRDEKGVCDKIAGIVRSSISGRASLNEAVTDVLVERGDREVSHKLAQNSGARFSEASYVMLAKKAETDQSLGEKLGVRLDIPMPLLRELLSRATDTVRSRMLTTAPREAYEQIQRALGGIASEIVRETTGPRDFSSAVRLVQDINKNGKLNESVVFEFASAHRYEEMVAALSLLSSAPINMIERLLKNVDHDGVIVVCKAAALKWSTASLILKNRFAHHSMQDEDLALAKSSFLSLSQAAAQRTLRFWQTQAAARRAN